MSTVSNKTVAKNSAQSNNRKDELGYSIAPHESYKSGPFLEDKALPIPKKYILTKTHCEFSVISSLHSYRYECARGWGRFPESDPSKNPDELNCKNGYCNYETHYDESIVKKAIHLIRNPLENIIARFNNAHKRNKALVNFTHSHPKEYIKMFHSWCEERDREALAKKYHHDVPNGVICASELFRYVQWHDHAIALAKDMNIPAMILHYEDYAKDLNNTVDLLFSFLEHDKVASAPPFFQHDYSFMYTNAEKEGIEDWVKVLASKELWKLLEHYF